MDEAQEKQKWDNIYQNLPVAEDESDHERRFDQEFSQMVEDLLPQGGKTLEAGSGAGRQSLSLARRGKFEVTLLDFSPEALKHAGILFGRENLPVTLIEASASLAGRPEFDLVFNAGVLEHYTEHDQVQLLQGMASRSRRYVLVLVPNLLCYWYWVWRVQVTAKNAWEYGVEVPALDLGRVFELAGLKFIGQAYLGKDWSESFILSLEGIDARLRQQLLEIHRSEVIPLAQRSYLLAALGCVPGSGCPDELPGWNQRFSDLSAASPLVVTSQAENVSDYFRRLDGLEQELKERIQIILSQADQLSALQGQVNAFAQQSAGQQQELARRQALIEEQSQALKAGQLRQAGLQAELKEREAALADQQVLIEAQAGQIASRQALLDEIHGSRGWRLVRWLWDIRLAMLPEGIPQFKIVRALFRRLRHPLAALSGWLAPSWQALIARLQPSFISWYAYYFVRYKQQRLRRRPGSLQKLRVPAQPGLVSIVLPVYNGAGLVGEALDSILAQTYPHFEVIAVDDGSTDDTPGILDEYARRDARIRVLHQPNQRLPRSLSNGFRLARGQYLTWTSDDNRLKPDFLAKMVAELESQPRVDMIYANEDILGQDGQPLSGSEWYKGYQVPPGSQHVYLPADPAELNIYPNNYVGAAFLYRAHVSWLLGDYSSLRFTVEDYDYWMQVNSLLTLRHTRFKDPVYDYRFHSSSLTSKEKELGILHNRARLMVFDDFRRDFYLSPLTWRIEPLCTASACQQAAARLASLVQQGGDMLQAAGPAGGPGQSGLWLPAVYLAVVGASSQPMPPAPPVAKGVFTALLVVGNQLPDQIPAGWDVCLGLGNIPDPPRLPQAYQGWLTAPDLATLAAAVELRARADHLRQIEAEIASPAPARFKVAVIICTFRRPASLVQAVRSVASQSMPLADYEVLVVNNAPGDGELGAIIAQLRQECFQAAPESLRLVECQLPGLSHARNVGISESRADILCFLDDDAQAGPGWLEETYRAFAAHPQVGVIGGHIRVVPPTPLPEAFLPGWEHYWSQMITPFTDYTEVSQWYEFPWGANWCARRSALLQAGGFRTRYGRRGNDYGGGEEVIAAASIQQLGYTIAILPQSQVLHLPEARRFTFEDVRKTIRAGLRVQYEMQKDLYLPLYFTLEENQAQFGKEQALLDELRLAGRADEPQARELAYRLQARQELLKEQRADLHARRRPFFA